MGYNNLQEHEIGGAVEFLCLATTSVLALRAGYPCVLKMQRIGTVALLITAGWSTSAQLDTHSQDLTS